MESSKDGNSLEAAVQAVVTSDDARMLAAEYAELGIDTFLAAGLARDVPIIGTIVGLTKTGITVRDRLFAMKLFGLLSELGQVDSAERRDLVQRLEGDAKYGRRVGEHLTELLERIDSHRKPRMVARVFLAYLRGEVDAVMLHRLCTAVERVPSFEIGALRPFCELPEKDRDAPVATLQNLHAAGLLSAASGWGSLVYEPTEAAQQFLHLGLDRLG